MRRRIIVSPAGKRNVTIDRCPLIKSREICTSSDFEDSLLRRGNAEERCKIIRTIPTFGRFERTARLHVDSDLHSP